MVEATIVQSTEANAAESAHDASIDLRQARMSLLRSIDRQDKDFVGPPSPGRLFLARRLAQEPGSSESNAHAELLAFVDGKTVTQLPQDLYIPPDALEVFLSSFEGPLDLLLYLIRKNNLDILDINVAEITEQYMQYVEAARKSNFELAAEYLLMAAMLAEIKSRCLLPRNEESEEDDDIDPRAELIRRLQEYERFKKAAEDIDHLPRLGRDIFLSGGAQKPDQTLHKPHPDVEMIEILRAFSDVLKRADMFEHHEIQKEQLSTRERMSQILDQLPADEFVMFGALFSHEEGRLGVVVTFLAMLELIKESLIEIIQHEAFGQIHVKARAAV